MSQTYKQPATALNRLCRRSEDGTVLAGEAAAAQMKTCKAECSHRIDISEIDTCTHTHTHNLLLPSRLRIRMAKWQIQTCHPALENWRPSASTLKPQLFCGFGANV